MLQYAAEQKVITEEIVCELHKLCMFPASYAGTYRNTNAYISGARTRVSAPLQIYQDLKFYFDDLLHHDFADPLEKAAYAHAEFVRIHPFPDGNGRTSRLLMNLSLKSDDYPLVCISNQNRSEYIETLDIYGVERDLKPFYDFLQKTMENDLDMFFDRFRDQYLTTEYGQKHSVLSM